MKFNFKNSRVASKLVSSINNRTTPNPAAELLASALKENDPFQSPPSTAELQAVREQFLPVLASAVRGSYEDAACRECPGVLTKIGDMVLRSGLLIRAMMYIGLVVIVLVLLFILSFYVYPRFPWLCSAIDLEFEVERLFKQHVIPIVDRFASPPPPPSSSGAPAPKEIANKVVAKVVEKVAEKVSDISETVTAILTTERVTKKVQEKEVDVQELAVLDRVAAAARALKASGVDYDDWVFFYMFREYMLGGTEDAMWVFTQFDGNVMSQMAPERIAKLLCSTANKLPDPKLFKAYVAGPFAAIEAFRKAIGSAAATLRTFRRKIVELDVLKGVLDVYYLDVAVNGYEKSMVRAWNMRRTRGFTFQLNILKVYFTPITRYIFEHQIKENAWGGFPLKVEKFRVFLVDGWKSLEKSVDDLRKKMISESFEVREGFIDIIIGFIQFLFQILQMIFMFIKKLGDFVKDPIGFIVWTIQIVVLIIIGIWLKIWGVYFQFLFSYPIAFVLVLLWCVLLTVMWIVIYAAMMLQMVLYTVVDMATGGLRLKLLRCENSFDSWALRPTYNNDNGYVRALFCFGPCSKGYVPRGPLCFAMKNLKSSFCPHQQIFSSCYYDALADETHKVPSSVDFDPELRFWTEEDLKQKRELAKFYDALALNMKQCKKKFTPYDPMIRTMCRNLKLLKPGPLMIQEHGVLKRICDVTYCDFEEPPADFCSPSPPPAPKPVTSNEIVEWILRSATVVTLVMVLFLTIGIIATNRRRGRLAGGV